MRAIKMSLGILAQPWSVETGTMLTRGRVLHIVFQEHFLKPKKLRFNRKNLVKSAYKI